MNSEEAKTVVRAQVRVTSQLISVAKAFILSNVNNSERYQTQALLVGFMAAQDSQAPPTVVINPAVDPTQTIQRSARHLSLTAAFVEALYGLVGFGLLIPSSNHNNVSPHIPWTTVHNGSGSSGGWSWNEIYFSIPSEVTPAPSLWSRDPTEPILETSIFVTEVVGGLAGDAIIDALSDAVFCMRAELHRPAVVMLGKGVEGAWIELGDALHLALNGEGPSHAKFLEETTGRNASFGRTIELVLKMCRQEATRSLLKVASVTEQQVEYAASWSHLVREARNAVHTAANSGVPATYETAHTMMLQARLNLRVLYKLREAAK